MSKFTANNEIVESDLWKALSSAGDDKRISRVLLPVYEGEAVSGRNLKDGVRMDFCIAHYV